MLDDVMEIDGMVAFAVKNDIIPEGNAEAFRAYLEWEGHKDIPCGKYLAEAERECKERDWELAWAEQMAEVRVSDEITDLVDAFNDVYQGEWETLADYAEEYLDGIGVLDDVPSLLRYHIDFEGFVRDLELGGEIWTADGTIGVHIYLNNW